MKCLQLAILLVFGTLLCGVAAVAGDSAPGYKQSYVILIKGSVSGSENVVETVDAGGNTLSTSDHEIFVTDGLETKRMAFSTRMQMAPNSCTPISYLYKYTTGDAGDSYEVKVKNGQIKRALTRNGHTTEASALLKPNTVILDFAVYHQYDCLVRLYDSGKGGRQIFSDFVPLIGSDISVAVTSLGDGELKLEKGSIAVVNYKVEFVGIAGSTLSVDKNKRLVRLIIPSQDLEVVRKDLLPANLGN
ncbi:MAG TPA: hypothetical protein VMG30_07805 [Acidobacteriota bacterium]|nr:hypothetical protein [Acidobacteriota bacterium]